MPFANASDRDQINISDTAVCGSAQNVVNNTIEMKNTDVCLKPWKHANMF